MTQIEANSLLPITNQAPVLWGMTGTNTNSTDWSVIVLVKKEGYDIGRHGTMNRELNNSQLRDHPHYAVLQSNSYEFFTTNLPQFHKMCNL